MIGAALGPQRPGRQLSRRVRADTAAGSGGIATIFSVFLICHPSSRPDSIENAQEHFAGIWPRGVAAMRAPPSAPLMHGWRWLTPRGLLKHQFKT